MKRAWLLKAVFPVLMLLLLALTVNAAEQAPLQVQTTKEGAKVEIEVVNEGKAIVSVMDKEENPVLGLKAADFTILRSTGRKANIISAQALSETQEMPRHIVLVLDNSYSMKQRNAIGALLAGVGELVKIIRPIDEVQIITFSEKGMNVGGRTLRVQSFKSNQPKALKEYAEKVYKDEILDKTFLYEAMVAGLESIRTMPEKEPRIMVVFSDGEDFGSALKAQDVLNVAQKAGRFNGYAIDYMEGPEKDKFLTGFAVNNKGQIFKAASEKSLVPIFQSVASKMEYYYVINYEFPLTGKLAVSPDTLTVEEVRTIDSSPLLGHIYFGEGSSTIPSQYVRFAGSKETAGFDEQKFQDSMEKYYQVLNIIGKRLADNPKASVKLIGCNSNMGKEKGQKKLSAKRADRKSVV
jgi:hypothetical protein